MWRGRVRADALDRFCDALWLEDGLSQNTIAAYRADLEQLQTFLDGDLLAADEAALFRFMASRKGRASSAARRLSSLKRFYQYCLRERHTDVDPTLKLDFTHRGALLSSNSRTSCIYPMLTL